MKSLDQWREQQDLTPKKPKPWHMTKPQIYDFWRRLPPSMPLAMSPIPYDHKGSTFDQDGIRITGSQAFIASVISRFKDVNEMKSPRMHVDPVYRQISKDELQKPTFVFYIALKEKAPATL